jgi:hypothetical protein
LEEVASGQPPPSSPNLHKKTNPIFKTLTAYQHEDSFRLLFPHKKEFTWIRNGTGRRLDYIWISYQLSGNILDSFTEPSSTIIDSDHKFVSTILNINTIQQTKLANYKNERQSYIDCNNSTPIQWKKFQKNRKTRTKCKKCRKKPCEK